MNAQIKGGVRNMRTLMAVAPFAAISSSSVHTLMLITRAVSSFIKLYLLLLFMRVLLSWFPAFNWEDQPWLALRQVCLSSACFPSVRWKQGFVEEAREELTDTSACCCATAQPQCAMLIAQSAQVTDPYLNLFRGLVPPLLGTIDFVSPAADPMPCHHTME